MPQRSRLPLVNSQVLSYFGTNDELAHAFVQATVPTKNLLASTMARRLHRTRRRGRLGPATATGRAPGGQTWGKAPGPFEARVMVGPPYAHRW